MPIFVRPDIHPVCLSSTIELWQYIRKGSCLLTLPCTPSAAEAISWHREAQWLIAFCMHNVGCYYWQEQQLLLFNKCVLIIFCLCNTPYTSTNAIKCTLNTDCRNTACSLLLLNKHVIESKDLDKMNSAENGWFEGIGPMLRYFIGKVIMDLDSSLRKMKQNSSMSLISFATGPSGLLALIYVLLFWI